MVGFRKLQYVLFAVALCSSLFLRCTTTENKKTATHTEISNHEKNDTNAKKKTGTAYPFLYIKALEFGGNHKLRVDTTKTENYTQYDYNYFYYKEYPRLTYTEFQVYIFKDEAG